MATLTFLADLDLDTLIDDGLDDVADLDVDSQTYATIIVKNVSTQVLPIVVSAQPNTPFVLSQGLVNVNAGASVLAEEQRFSTGQLQNLANLGLVKTSAQYITITT